jgi:hypothetical protein
MENNNKKTELGQFFTAGKDSWIFPQVAEFIKSVNATTWVDPFCGNGDLFKYAQDFGVSKTIGYDIDKSLPNIIVNDSLGGIPHWNDSLLVTNPPYLAKVSAAKKKIDYSKYYALDDREDLYQVALDSIMRSFYSFFVVIIPESFINSNYPKSRVNSITICEKKLFNDTTEPVVVVCFDNTPKTYDKIKVYKDDKYACTLDTLENYRLKCSNDVDMTFNTLDGWLALRAVDYIDPNDRIRFGFKNDFDYDWSKGIKVSSRHMSLIDIDVPEDKRAEFIKNLNVEIEKMRAETFDIILTPFMGNNKAGIRRRRLDFYTARAIIENVYKDTIDDQIKLF